MSSQRRRCIFCRRLKAHRRGALLCLICITEITRQFRQYVAKHGPICPPEK